ncbi:lipocalin family protein [bacterium]|nr:lipocalin family protein [bacterium]MBU1636466.1 lipocalin family protein [bacterium]MBU1921532.1 lipocalin family protein [bacterium]
MSRLFKLYFISLCSVLLSNVIFAQEVAMEPLRAAADIDIERYMGTWYEIARLPNWFQKKCAGDVTAAYTLQDNGTILVVNRCRKAGGQMVQAEGLAKQANMNGPNTKLKVRFAPAFLSFLPFVWGNYWIIDLAPDYRYAVIGEPDRKYLWILSRSPAMDEITLQTVLDKVREQGYDLTDLIRTEQSDESR